MLQKVSPAASRIADDIGEQLRNDALYDTYAQRQVREVAALQKDENVTLPSDFSVAGLSGLSSELKSKIARVDPKTLFDLRRIEGMTPAALIVIQSALKKAERVG